MAVDQTVKSVGITNRDATPRVLNNPGISEGGREKIAIDYVTVPLNLSITSVMRIVSIPSNAIVTQFQFQSEAQTAGKVDLSVYRTTADGGAVATNGAAYFASAVDCASAVTPTDEINESTSNTIAKQIQPIWQALGYAKDPNCMFDVCATVVTTDMTTATGKMLVKLRYVDGGG